MMTAVVVGLSGSRVLSASYRADHTTRDALSFELSSAASMAELIALSFETAGFLSISHV
jgi:hypothetical protein